MSIARHFPNFIQDKQIKLHQRIISALLLASCGLVSQTQASVWNQVVSPPASVEADAQSPSLKIIAYYDLDKSELLAQINQQSDESTALIELPDAANNMLRFKLIANQVLPSALANRYPDIQTFNLVGVDHHSRGKLEIRSTGVYAAYRLDGHSYYLEPDPATTHYRLYDGNEQLRQPFVEQVRELDLLPLPQNRAAKPLVEGTVRQYRLAIATTGEYSAKFGADKYAVLAALATVINRINLVFEVDMGVSFVLADNNDQIIFLDADSDPYTNTTDDIDINYTVLNEALGNNGYDIGHVFTTEGGGLASVGVVCRSANKADGVTGSNRPTGDSFYIDLVAHEIGHQLGANHSFNSESAGCEGNRSSRSAWEPGSGTTIMAYAGLCGTENLQNYSDDYFHIGSVLEYRQRLSSGLSGNCGEIITGTNDAPTADAGNDYIIPANSPFVLTAEAADPDNDGLLYNWEQYFVVGNDEGEDPRPNASNSVAEMSTDDGTRPLFRSWPPTDNPQRYLPRLQDVIQGSDVTVKGETYPTTERTLRFRLSVRDNQGGLTSDKTLITVTPASGPLVVHQPDADTLWDNDSGYEIQWEVADTDLPPVSCSQMDVWLSVDGGQSFPLLIAEQLDNSGEAVLPGLGAIQTDNARLMLKCHNNIFYAVNPATFSINVTINQPPSAQDDSASVEQDSTNNRISVLTNDSDPDSQDSIAIVAVEYSGSGTVTIDNEQLVYSPAAGFSGSDSLSYTIADEQGLESSATVTINVQARVVTPPASGGNNTSSGGGGSINYIWLVLLLLIRRTRCAG
ncbi:reprolysin-like metallopeptidase [Neptunicella sp. SCSIO 80796]|uniref:reprolysin-like metallopeptidase n=1 Tax=Neptunicella plasticusilytica TaxID=3117012 RepID=UPI003A4D33E5